MPRTTTRSAPRPAWAVRRPPTGSGLFRRLLGRAQGRDRLHKAISLQLAQHVLYCFGRLRPRVRDLLDARRHGPAVDTDLIQHEVIRRFRLDVPRLQIAGREVL